MTSLDQQLQVLNSIVLQLETDINGLKRSVYRQSCTYTDTGNGRHMHPVRTVPGSGPNDGELFDIESTWEDVQSMALTRTYRETQILNYVADGTTNKGIAYILGISEQTIKNHMSAILLKLHANSRAHAVVLAIRKGFISAERKYEDMVAVS